MPLARIRTHFPEEVGELAEALLDAGYVVETALPGEVHVVPADLEISVDKSPVVEAWRHIPDVDTMYIAPGTPESRDIRSTVGADISYEPLVARMIIFVGETYLEAIHWITRQYRELRSQVLALRSRWTPPREYHAPVHLEPAAPSMAESPDAKKKDVAVEEAVREMEALRLREEREQRELAEQARLAEENRRRARDAEEARILLEERQKVEEMVQATEVMRMRLLESSASPAQLAPRRPRRLLHTRRERAFLRAGIAAFILSVGLAVLGAEALHPKPAGVDIPKKAAAPNPERPFAKVENQGPDTTSANRTTAIVAATTTAALKPSAAIHPHSAPVIAEDEVIVRKAPAKKTKPASKPAIAHYSDLD